MYKLNRHWKFVISGQKCCSKLDVNIVSTNRIMKVIKKRIPNHLNIVHSVDRIDYADAYFGVVPLESKISPQRMLELFYQSLPVWLRILLKVLSRLAKLLGVSITDHTKEEVATKNGFLQFKVIKSSDNEILTGEDEPHLNFRLSFFVEENEMSKEIGLATIVKMNNTLGRLYFFPVRFFHQQMVPRVLNSMLKKLNLRSKQIENAERNKQYANTLSNV